MPRKTMKPRKMIGHTGARMTGKGMPKPSAKKGPRTSIPAKSR